MTGTILIDKPEGMTSFGVVARVRRIVGEKKAGHSGTLDPFATGVLTVMLGGATRFTELLGSHDKTYIARVKTGVTTDTLDMTGEVLSTSDKKVTAAEFAAVLSRFEGEIMQTPPMYSALMKDGVRLYELARKGIEVEREARRVTVHYAKLVSEDEKDGSFDIEVSCSTGTYIRSLAADIGEALGCGAALSALRRTSANGFSIEQCYTLEALQTAAEKGEVEKILIPVDKALDCYERVEVSIAQATRFHNGGELDAGRIKNLGSDEVLRVYSPQGVFLGIGENRDGALWPKKILP